MLMVLIFWDVDIDGNLCRYYRYRYWGRYIDTSGFDNQHFPIVLIIDGIDTSTSAIVSMSMTQPITSMAPPVGDDDAIDDASMADP
jgi:hypothetical protein